MKLTASLLGAAVALAAIVPASAGTIGDGYDKWTIYSDATVACIEADAAAKLTPAQHVYLESIMDDTAFNAGPTRRANGLTLADMAKVHGFLWGAGPDCVLKG
jgi:hypothetical protein